MDRSFNLIDALRVLINWKYPILIFVILSSLGGVAVALLLPEYYKSQVVFYPTNPARTESSVLFSETTSEFAADFSGTKNDINRLLTIATSSSVVDFMVNHFNLATHYGYDTTSTSYKRYKVTEEFKDNYSVLKTENGAIEITIIDTDPILAADMVNMAAVMIDKLNNSSLQDNKESVTAMFSKSYADKVAEVQSLSDTLAKLKGEYGIEIVSSGSPDGLPLVKGSNAQVVETYKVLLKRQESAVTDLNKVKSLFDRNNAASTAEISSMFIIEKGYPAERKVKPIRWAICVSATLISMFLGIAGALLIDRMKYIKQELDNAQ
jgi:uncharacterized protein involved in exopolysaccharide biosynthesis